MPLPRIEPRFVYGPARILIAAPVGVSWCNESCSVCIHASAVSYESQSTRTNDVTCYAEFIALRPRFNIDL